MFGCLLQTRWAESFPGWKENPTRRLAPPLAQETGSHPPSWVRFSGGLGWPLQETWSQDAELAVPGRAVRPSHLPTHPLASHSHLLLVRGALAASGSSHTKQNSRNTRLGKLLAVFSVPFCFLKVSGAGAQSHDLPGRILVDCLCAACPLPPQLRFSAASENPRRSLLERTVIDSERGS